MMTSPLVLFILVVLVDVVVLAWDGLLYLFGLSTITEVVWQHPWIGWVLVGWQLVGAVALAWHFFG